MLTLTNTSDYEFASDADAGSERRRGLRITQDRPIKVFEPLGCRYFGGKTTDISSTGLRIELPIHAPVMAGETVSVHVGLSDRGLSLANRKQMMQARVVWVDRHHAMTDGKIFAGVEFMASISAGLDAA